MNCQRAFRLLNPFLEGELEGTQSERLQEHLAYCARCGGELEGLKRSLALLEGMPSLNPPLGFTARVMALVLRQKPALTPAKSGTLGWVLASMLGGFGALLVYLFLGEQGWPWDVAVVESMQPMGLEDLASLLASMEVGLVIGVSLLFVAMASLLVQLMGKDQRSQYG